MKIDEKKLKRAIISTVISCTFLIIIFLGIYFFNHKQIYSWKFIVSMMVIYFLSNYFFEDLKWKDLFSKKSKNEQK